MSNLKLVDALNAHDVQIAINHYKTFLRLVDKIKERNIKNFSTLTNQWLKYQKIRESNKITSTIFHLLVNGKLECKDLENQIKALYQ